MSPAYKKIYAIVAKIPRGKVATYGQVAHLAGLPGRARQVGYALHSIPPGTDLAWHRVVNSKGEISVRSNGSKDSEQQVRLESEGVVFRDTGRISLVTFQWKRV